jgi:2-polyprenyl-3-methyl-5-hydroxy-6-metoxy-1,4-benzoquinol methylase
MEKIDKCLVCGSDEFTTVLTCKDHFLTKEIFNIVECKKCGFRFTNPRPDANDIYKYYESENYISYSHSKKGIINFLYQIIKNHSLKQKFNLINKYKTSSGKKILDIGCATGDFLNVFKKNNWLTYGIEPNEKVRNHAVALYNLNIKDEKELSKLEDNSFDVITMWHVLEHVHQLDKRITEVKKLLKKDGILIIAVPNYKSLDADIYKEFWAGYDIPRHLYHFSQSSIKNLFEKYNFKVEKKFPLKFDSFYISLLSEKYKTEKSRFIKAFLNGLKSNISANKNKNDYSGLIYLIKNM